MEIRLAVFADAANVTDNGKLNMLGVFQNINAPSVPVQLAQMHIVLTIRADLGEVGTDHNFTMRLVDQDMREVAKLPEFPFRIPDNLPTITPEVNLIVGLPGPVFPIFGPYQMQVYIDGTLYRSMDLMVQPVILPAPE